MAALAFVVGLEGGQRFTQGRHGIADPVRADVARRSLPGQLRLRLVDSNDGCTPLAGYALYLWHCDRDGNYSMYQSASEANYLRGVQPVDSKGLVTFTSIFPAAYSGRWPHAHFEVYPSVGAATSARKFVGTSPSATVLKK